MTASDSPLSAIKVQADMIAHILKKAERGEAIDVKFAEKIERARLTKSFKFGIVMGDKAITIEMLWETIREMNEGNISDFIVQQMARRSGVAKN